MGSLTKLTLFIAVVSMVSVLHALVDNVRLPQTNAGSATVQQQSQASTQALITTSPSLEQTIHTSTGTTNIYNSQGGNFYFRVPIEQVSDNSKSQETTPASMSTRYLQADPLKSQFDIQVTGPIVRAKVTQTFVNPYDKALDGDYVFPLPESAAVDHLEITIGDRVISGEIFKKETAKQKFEQAKKQGKSASLVSQLRPNVFHNEVANIPANGEMIVSIEYQHLLDYDVNGYELFIPTSIPVRYSPDGTPDIQRTDPTEILEINVEINMGIPLQNIDSYHHPINTLERSGHRYYIQNIAPDTGVFDYEQSFVLKFAPEFQEATMIGHYTENFDGAQYGLISLYGPEKPATLLSRDVTFILDTSGSMVGDPLFQAKEALTLALQNLNANDRFNVVEFNSEPSAMWGTYERASDANIVHATRFIQNLEADGGTEILSAFEMAFELSDYTHEQSDRVRQIVFITDGSVSNEAQVRTLVEEQIGKTKLFPIGLGSAPNDYFLQTLANAGRGSTTLIHHPQDIQPKMQVLFDKLQYASVQNIELSLNKTSQSNASANASVSDANLESFPTVVPDIYAKDPVHIFYRIAKPEGVSTLSNDMASQQPLNLIGNTYEYSASGVLQTNTWQREVSGVDVSADSLSNAFSRDDSKQVGSRSGIAKQWARSKARQLSQGRFVYADETKHQIQELGLKYQIVTPYTSLLAIDHAQYHERVAREQAASALQMRRLLNTGNPLMTPSIFGALLAFILALTIALLANKFLSNHGNESTNSSNDKNKSSNEG